MPKKDVPLPKRKVRDRFNLSHSLVLDTRADASLGRARECFDTFLASSDFSRGKRPSDEARDLAFQTLHHVVDYYWQRFDNVRGAPRSEMVGISKIQASAAEKLKHVLDTPSVAFQSSNVQSTIKPRGPFTENEWQTFRDVLDHLSKWEPPAPLRGEEVQSEGGNPSTSRHIHEAFRALAELWETLTGEVVTGYRAAHPDKEGFKAPGAQFIFELLRAIDPTITWGAVEEAIRKLGGKPKEKNSLSP